MLDKKTLAGQVNTKTASITDFKIDREGPVIDSVTLTKKDGSKYEQKTWSNQDVIVTYEAHDTGVGMDENVFTTTFSQDGMFVHTVRPKDKLGNAASIPRSYDIYIDKTPPTISDVGWRE